MNPKNNSLLNAISQANPQYFCLLAALTLEFVLMAGGVYGYFFINQYTMIPCMVFLGIVMVRKIRPQVRWQLWLGLIAIAWFSATQLLHYVAGMQVRQQGLFFSIYLLAFPFAGFAEDGKKQIGLKFAGFVYIAAALVLAGLTSLLAVDALPGFLHAHVYWDGARLHAMWQSNICANIFMIGIAFSLGFSVLLPQKWHRGLCLAVAAVLFAVMALTNSRTAILMACTMIGGFVFFIIFRKRSWQRFLAGAIAAVLVIFVLFSGASALFQSHNDRMIADLLAEQSQNGFNEDSPLIVNPETGEMSLETVSVQGSLSSNLKSLNGRTSIWKSALLAIQNDPSILIWGLDYSGSTLAQFNPFPPDHAHNAWVETLLCLGLPGLMIALCFTALAVKYIWTTFWCYETDLWHKAIALLLLCLLGSAVLEPYLFLSDHHFHYADFIFFLCLGYLSQQPKNNAA